MGKYLKLFETHAEYESFIQTDYDKPNVSYCEDNKDVHYNPIPPKATVRMTFTVSEPSKERISVAGDLSPFGGSEDADGLSKVETMRVDGVEVDMETAVTKENIVDMYGVVIDGYFYNFTESGQHTIEYILNDMTVNGGLCVTIGDFEYFGISFPSKITNASVEIDAYIIEGLSFGYSPAIESVTILDSVIGIDYNIFEGSTGLTSLTLNTNAATNGVFKDLICITNVVIGDSVTSIGNYAFQDCTGLTSVTIPDSVTSIGEWAFDNCESLSSITIPNSVINIGNYAFAECDSLTNITIPNSVTNISEHAFDHCTNLTSVTMPNSITSIGVDAFNRCESLSSITIPNSVTSIGSGAFQYCISLTTFTIPNNITNINNYTFQGCSGLTSVTIPNSVTSIGSGAFRYCSSLPNITINYGTIGEGALNGCFKMLSVTIGSGVTSIGRNAFQGCNRLENITSLAMTAPTINSDTFYSIKTNGTLTVPSGSSGYDVWMGTGNYYLGKYNWTKVEQ